jgi:ribonuclease Z
MPDLWLTGWFEPYFGARKAPYRVIGPTGARELMENLERAYARHQNPGHKEKLPFAAIATDVTEFDHDGLVYEKNGVKVIAFEVDHGVVRAAVLSSDTRHNQNVIKYGRGADLLVHEVAMARPQLRLRPTHYRASHKAL